MYGKDLTESAILSSKVCNIMGKNHQVVFLTNFFWTKKEKKISKSKGNGISIEDWLNYASPESLSMYMYQNPKRAKKLYFDVVPKAVDEYLSFLEKYPKQTDREKNVKPCMACP